MAKKLKGFKIKRGKSDMDRYFDGFDKWIEKIVEDALQDKSKTLNDVDRIIKGDIMKIKFENGSTMESIGNIGDCIRSKRGESMKNILLIMDSLIFKMDNDKLTYSELKIVDEKLTDLQNIINDKEMGFKEYWNEC